jgi:hypothetical protein
VAVCIFDDLVGIAGDLLDAAKNNLKDSQKRIENPGLFPPPPPSPYPPEREK